MNGRKSTRNAWNSSSSGLFQVTVADPPPAVMVRFVSRPDCISRRLDRRSAWSRNHPNCSVTVFGGLPRLLPTLATLPRARGQAGGRSAVSYTHLRAHETRHDLVCRLLL